MICSPDCWRESRCPGCGRPIPPVGRDVAPEAAGGYCERECAESRQDRRRHLWDEHDDARHYVDPEGWAAHVATCEWCSA